MIRDFQHVCSFAPEGTQGGATPPETPNPGDGSAAQTAKTMGTSGFAKNMRQEAPVSTGASAAVMSPVAAAGYKLALCVLGMAGGSIVLLLAYLLSMDLFVSADIHEAYRQVLSPSRTGAEFYTLGQLEQLSADLSNARQNAGFQMDSASTQNAISIIATLNDLPSITVTERAQLQDCVPLPSDASRNDKIDTCLAIIDSVRQAALEAAASLSDAQTASASVDQIASQREAFHSFWLQAAQLILLNLLLPLLTALFGYIFGTQQAQSRN